MRVAVVGAGMAGLTAAKRLTAAGAEVAVFDKSRGTGGRLATRRAGTWRIDHGAPWVDAEGAEFADHLTRLEDVSRAARIAPDRTIGVPSMSALAPDGASVSTGVEVGLVEVAPGGVWLSAVDGARHGPFDRAILAIPAPQAARLAAGLGGVEALGPVVMDPVWTLLVAWAEPPPLGRPAGPIETVVPMEGRPGRDGQRGAFAAHATSGWSAAHLEVDRPEMAPRLLDAVAADGPDPDYVAAHRWRFARASRPLGADYAGLAGRLVLAGGDWALGDRAEDAFLSGRSMAAALIEGA